MGCHQLSGPSQERTLAATLSKVSVSTRVGQYGLQKVRIGAESRACFNYSKASFSSRPNHQARVFLVRIVRGQVIRLQSRINFLQKLQNLRKDQIPLTFKGSFQLATTLTFSELTRILSVVIIKPRNQVNIIQNSLFLMSAWRPALASQSRTAFMCASCYEGSSEKIRILLIYTIQVMSRRSPSTKLI